MTGKTFEDRKKSGSRGDRRPDPWHFDRRIPLTLTFMFIIQAASSIWWAAGQTFTSHDHERRLELIETFDGNVNGQLKNIGEHLARIEQRETDSADTLVRIESYIHGGRK